MPRYHAQPWVKGGREPLPSCVVPKIRAKVTQLATAYGVSRSWVVATLLAEALEIPIVSYTEEPWKVRTAGDKKDRKQKPGTKARAA